MTQIVYGQETNVKNEEDLELKLETTKAKTLTLLKGYKP
jgi:hypothetical protein